MVTYYYCIVKVCVPQYDSVTAAADGYVEFTAKLGLKNKSWQKLHDDLLNQQPDFRTFVQDLKRLHYNNSQVLADKLIDAGKRLGAYLDDRIALYDKSIACIESSGGLKSRSEEWSSKPKDWMLLLGFFDSCERGRNLFVSGNCGQR